MSKTLALEEIKHQAQESLKEFFDSFDERWSDEYRKEKKERINKLMDTYALLYEH